MTEYQRRRQEEWTQALRAKGHEPKMDGGVLDIFAHSSQGYGIGHNGPGCDRCGWSCCWHCDDTSKIPECTE